MQMLLSYITLAAPLLCVYVFRAKNETFISLCQMGRQSYSHCMKLYYERIMSRSQHNISAIFKNTHLSCESLLSCFIM